ncbi:MAG: J domain-containing protein [Acidobacteriota bacterium]
MLKTILGLVFFWVLLSVIRSLIEAAPGNPRRYAPPSTPSRRQRQRALSVLGLKEGATPSQIKQSFKHLAKQYHPDRVAHLGPELVELTAEKFRQVHQAYEFLNRHGSR